MHEFKTIHGYPTEELVLFAAMCRRHGIEEKDLHNFCCGVLNGWKCGADDFNRVMLNMLEKHIVDGETTVSSTVHLVKTDGVFKLEDKE